MRHPRTGVCPRTYRTWSMMKNRCRNENAENYAFYGGRGITVCEAWLSYDAFVRDMGTRPEGSELDRIDNDGNYEPANCRWATKKAQCRNRRSSRYITIDGRRATVAEWAELSGIDVGTLHGRLKLGWPADRLLAPVRTWST